MLETGSNQDDRRLLLLEFVTHERWVFDSRYFPFIKGCAEQLGIEALWICFGKQFVTEKVSPSEIRQYMHLEAEDLALLEEHVEKLRPSHVITNHPVSEAVMSCLKGMSDHVSVLHLSNLQTQAGSLCIDELGLQALHAEPLKELQPGQGPAGELTSFGSPMNHFLTMTNWLLFFLGESRETCEHFDKYIAGTFQPSYDAVMGNGKASQYKPHITIVGGMGCDHRKKLAKNPHYEGLDFSSCSHDFGCGYCGWYRGPNSDLKSDPLRLAEDQFRRIVETAGEHGRNCGAFDVFDIRLFRKIDRFFDMIFRLGVLPSTFCFEPRADRFVEVAQALERILPRLAEFGHQVRLFRMGLETLVEEENDFYNKHISLKQIDQATRRLKQIAELYPTAFEYDASWGYITCSPWTTLENLEITVERAIEREFDPKGVWLYTPVLLYRGTALTELAKLEGDIVQDDCADLSLLYEPAVNQVAFTDFLHWRFKDERTAVAFGLIVRFCAAALRGRYPDTLFEDDVIYRYMLDKEPSQAAFSRPDLFAREAIAAVKASSDPRDKIALVDKALERYAKHAGRPTYDRQFKLRFLIDAVREHLDDQIPDIKILEAREKKLHSGIVLRVVLGNTEYTLILKDRNPGAACTIQSEHFGVEISSETGLKSKEDIENLRRLVVLYDQAIARYAPELLSVS